MAELATDSPHALTRILQGAQLPALPQSAIRLLELSQNPKNGPVEFALPIETDPGLAGQVLKFVNSAYFGFSREISSVKLAITMVGIRTIKNFALWSAVFSLMPNPKCGPFDLKSLWQDSLRRALFARSFGKLLGMREAEEPFAAALLQDMAVPLLAKQLPDDYAEMLEMREQGKVRLSQLEKDRFGWTHYDAAVRMGQQWNLPEEFITLIQHHTTLDEMMNDPQTPPGRLAVALSALLPAGADDSWHECAQFERAFQKLCPAGGPTPGEFLERIDHEFVEFAPLLKISAPAKSLATSYQEALQAAS